MERIERRALSAKQARDFKNAMETLGYKVTIWTCGQGWVSQDGDPIFGMVEILKLPRSADGWFTILVDGYEDKAQCQSKEIAPILTVCGRIS